MNLKGKRGDFIYNKQGKLNSEYKGWLTGFKADRKKAFCKCGDQMIDISSMGESTLKSHMRSKRHKNNGPIGGEQAVTLSLFVLYHVEMEIQLKQEKREHRNHDNEL